MPYSQLNQQGWDIEQPWKTHTEILIIWNNHVIINSNQIFTSQGKLFCRCSCIGIGIWRRSCGWYFAIENWTDYFLSYHIWTNSGTPFMCGVLSIHLIFVITNPLTINKCYIIWIVITGHFINCTFIFINFIPIYTILKSLIPFVLISYAMIRLVIFSLLSICFNNLLDFLDWE